MNKLNMNLQKFAGEVKGQIDRKYMAHFLDSSFGDGSNPTWVRLGKDLEEYNVELNPDTESKKNILGTTTMKHNGYNPTSEADPFYANVGDPLFEHLQEIIDDLIKDDGCKTRALEVHMWDGDETTGYKAVMQECMVIPKSYGGDTSGYQIPFEVTYIGEKTKGTYAPKTKTFTPTTSE